MESPALFQDLLVSRRRVPARSRRPAWIAVAAVAHAAGAIVAFVVPLILLDAVPAPRAAHDFIVPPYRPPGGRMSGPGGGVPAGTVRSAAARPAPRASLSDPTKPEPFRPPDPNASHVDAPAPDSPGTQRAAEGFGQGGPDGGGDPDGCAGCGSEGDGDGTGRGPGGSGSPFGEGVLDPSTPNLTQASLIPESRALPRYPELARRSRVTGMVVLAVVIRADGSVGAIEVVRGPDPRWGFDLEAIEAVKQWRYRPALLAGTAVSVHAQVIVEFAINE